LNVFISLVYSCYLGLLFEPFSVFLILGTSNVIIPPFHITQRDFVLQYISSSQIWNWQHGRSPVEAVPLVDRSEFPLSIVVICLLS